MSCRVKEEQDGLGPACSSDSPCMELGDWPALVLSTAFSLGEPKPRAHCTHVQAAGGELVGGPCPDRARLSIHRGRRGMQEFLLMPRRLTGCPAQLKAL